MGACLGLGEGEHQAAKSIQAVAPWYLAERETWRSQGAMPMRHRHPAGNWARKKEKSRPNPVPRTEPRTSAFSGLVWASCCIEVQGSQRVTTTGKQLAWAEIKDRDGELSFSRPMNTKYQDTFACTPCRQKQAAQSLMGRCVCSR